MSGRPLEPGESYVSVILPEGDGVKRLDVAASEWKDADASAVGWWRSRMPLQASKKLQPAPNGVLLDTLSQLLESPGKESLAYVLALLLVRRRVLVEEESLEETQTASPSYWALSCPADGRQWNVPIIMSPGDALLPLQQELNALLFTEA